MPRACTFSLLFPIAGLLALLYFGPTDGTLLSSGYMGWFVVGAVLQVSGALLLYRPSAGSWKRGWSLLWLACAAYMGGYSNLYLQEKDVGDLTTSAVAVAKEQASVQRLRDSGAAEDEVAAARELYVQAQVAWKQLNQRLARALDPEQTTVDQLRKDAETLIGLQYVLSILFVGAFYSLSAFATREAQQVYDIADDTLEDPLAFKEQYGL